MTLTGFLLARISEDERDARESADLDGDYFDSNHQGRWTPQRVLAECEAKRRIVEAVEADQRIAAKDVGRHALRLLALPYAHHEDYREEWRP